MKYTENEALFGSIEFAIWPLNDWTTRTKELCVTFTVDFDRVSVSAMLCYWYWDALRSLHR